MGSGGGYQEKRKKKIREERACTGNGNGLWSEVYHDDLSSLHLGCGTKTSRERKVAGKAERDSK